MKKLNSLGSLILKFEIHLKLNYFMLYEMKKIEKNRAIM